MRQSTDPFKATIWPVTRVSVGGYYDYPQDGWLRCGPRNRYHFFELTKEEWRAANPADEDDGRWLLEWSVYKVPHDIALPRLQRRRLFRKMVGWHFDYVPGTARGFFNARTHPNWKAFYDLPPLSPMERSAWRLIGVTDDLRNIKLLEPARA